MEWTSTSIVSTGEDDASLVVQVFDAAGFPPPVHPAEADLFARHQGVPGHDQAALDRAAVLMVGAGGLGSWTGLGLVRSGIRRLTIVDPDTFDRTNAPRQLMYGEDLRQPKAVVLAKNLVPHMIAGGTITAMTSTFEDVLRAELALSADVVLALVDNNPARLAVVRFARQSRIPAVFTMLSIDGMRLHSFLQGPDPADACLWCALPNLDPEAVAPCASGVISSCLAAAADAVFFTHRALMGWSHQAAAFNWREQDLAAIAPSHTGLVQQRPRCPVCAGAQTNQVFGGESSSRDTASASTLERLKARIDAKKQEMRGARGSTEAGRAGHQGVVGLNAFRSGTGRRPMPLSS